MKRPYPLVCEPVFKERVWGGRALERFFGGSLPAGSVGEAWVLGEHPHGTNTVVNGPLAGSDLGAVCRRHGAAVLGTRGTRAQAERLPLLVKLLDARDRLSVQVHPADGDPVLAPGETGKTEMWYILDAEPGATIVYGLREGVGPREFARAVDAGRVQDCLREVPARPGDAFLIPAGTIHALGAGVLVAEIQQSSDTTYRVYDWDRPGLDGKPRELHVREALQVTRYSQPTPPRRAEADGSNRWRELSRSAPFVVEKGFCRGEWVEETSRETFQALLVGAGAGRLEWDGGEVPLTPGQAVLLPAALGPYALHGDMEVLRAWLPAPPAGDWPSVRASVN